MRFSLLSTAPLLLLSACGALFDCPPDGTLTGNVASVDVDACYVPEAVWFNQGQENAEVSDVDKEVMTRIGLDPNDDADVARYQFFNFGYDLRVLSHEIVREGLKRDFGVYFFGLAERNAQPGDEIAAANLSDLQAALESDSVDELRDAFRTTVDNLRASGAPGALAAFAPDRTGEKPQRWVYINLLAEDVRLSTGGTFTFTFGDGEAATYPLRDVEAISMSGRGTFSDGEILAQFEDLELKIEDL